ncbi:MAG: cupin domain-containing protein [Halioglobus sp.]
MSNSPIALNTDLEKRVVIRTDEMDWTPSPAGHVLRKRLHLSGRSESGQVTSVVRYMPGAHFPSHEHPEGEEIFVLDGVFSDEYGNWPAGTYLLNPEGFAHAPFSQEGCTLFVKLRQFPGTERDHVATQTRDKPWRASVRKTARWKKLYAQEPYPEFMRLEQWEIPSDIGEITFPLGAELFVLKGSFDDAHGHYPQNTWLRIPAGESLTPTGLDFCELYIKEGGFTFLR